MITDNMVQLQRKEKGEKELHFTHRQSRRAGGGRRRRRCRGCGVSGMLYADDAGIAIIRRVGEDDDGDRDCVLGVRAYGLRGTDIICLQTKGGGKVSFTINAAG